jgi:hypothetical protein
VLVAGIYLAIALALCVLAACAVLGIIHLHMSGSAGVERDGLNRGWRAPSWSLPDPTGRNVVSPPLRPFQLVVFSDHSLKSFPSVVEGLRDLCHEPELEIVLLTRAQSDPTNGLVRLLRLDDIPVVAGSPSLYARYNVRVMPWVMFVDSSGIVRASSLVNHARQLTNLWRLARAPITYLPQQEGSRSFWRLRRSFGGVHT